MEWEPSSACWQDSSVAFNCTPWFTPWWFFYPFAVNTFLSPVKSTNRIISLDLAVTFLTKTEVELCKAHFARRIASNEIFSQSTYWDKICESNLSHYFVTHALSFPNSSISVITLALRFSSCASLNGVLCAAGFLLSCGTLSSPAWCHSLVSLWEKNELIILNQERIVENRTEAIAWKENTFS